MQCLPTYMKKPSRLSYLWKYITTREWEYWFLFRNYGRWGYFLLEFKGSPIIKDI